MQRTTHTTIEQKRIEFDAADQMEVLRAHLPAYGHDWRVVERGDLDNGLSFIVVEREVSGERDAARYRFVRELLGPGQKTRQWFHFVGLAAAAPDTAEGFDAAVDATMKGQA